MLLQIGYCIDDNYNYSFEPLISFHYNAWNRLKISQTDGTFSIEINDIHFFSVDNSNPQTWTNVKVVTGNTYGNVAYVPALGQYRNFVISNLEPVVDKLLCLEFNLSIDLYLGEQPVTSPTGSDTVPFISFSGSSRMPSISAANHDYENVVLKIKYLKMTRNGLPSLEDGKFLQGGWK